MGTDISDAAVARASYGAFNKFEIDRGLPKDKLQKYFDPSGDSWKVKDEIRAMSTFKKFNLLDSFIGLGKFDIMILDEVLEGSIDDNGKSVIISLLKEKASELGSLFVISHDDYIKDSFDNSLRVKKINGISRIN